MGAPLSTHLVPMTTHQTAAQEIGEPQAAHDGLDQLGLQVLHCAVHLLLLHTVKPTGRSRCRPVLDNQPNTHRPLEYGEAKASVIAAAEDL